jgi:hypothetical protein
MWPFHVLKLSNRVLDYHKEALLSCTPCGLGKIRTFRLGLRKSPSIFSSAVKTCPIAVRLTSGLNFFPLDLLFLLPSSQLFQSPSRTIKLKTLQGHDCSLPRGTEHPLRATRKESGLSSIYSKRETESMCSRSSPGNSSCTA